MKYYYLSCFLIIASVASSQTTYDEFEHCTMKKPSFETMGYCHCKEANELVSLVEAELLDDIVASALTMFNAVSSDLVSQQSVLSSFGINCDQIRYKCLNPESRPAGLSDEEGDAFIQHLEANFSIDEATYTKTKTYIESFKSRAKSQAFNYRLSLLARYLDLAYEIKYSKSEILRDFTGYCDIGNYLLDRVASKYCTGDREQGLGAEESIRRLEVIKDCRDSRRLVAASPDDSNVAGELYDLRYQCNGNVSVSYAGKSVEFENQGLKVRVFDYAGNMINEVNQVSIPKDSEALVALKSTRKSLDNKVLFIILQDKQSNVLATQKVFCTN